MMFRRLSVLLVFTFLQVWLFFSLAQAKSCDGAKKNEDAINCVYKDKWGVKVATQKSIMSSSGCGIGWVYACYECCEADICIGRSNADGSDKECPGSFSWNSRGIPTCKQYGLTYEYCAPAEKFCDIVSGCKSRIAWFETVGAKDPCNPVECREESIQSNVANMLNPEIPHKDGIGYRVVDDSKCPGTKPASKSGYNKQLCEEQQQTSDTNVLNVATFAELVDAIHDKYSGPSTLRFTNDIVYPTDTSGLGSGSGSGRFMPGINLKYPVRIVGACSSTSLVVSGTVAAGTCMLDAKETGRHFNVNTAGVVFEKLALVNGGLPQGSVKSYLTGSAVQAEFINGAIRFENVIFKDNGFRFEQVDLDDPDQGPLAAVRVHGIRSATFSTKTTATFSSCHFLRNKGRDRGGAVLTSGTTSNFVECTFEGNEAKWGGAVSLTAGSSSTFTLCTFQGNRASEGWSEGGNVQCGATSDSSLSSASFYACTFNDYLNDPDHGVMKSSKCSSSTFYDNPLPPGTVLSPPSPPLTPERSIPTGCNVTGCNVRDPAKTSWAWQHTFLGALFAVAALAAVG